MHELHIFELGKMQLCSLCWESVTTCHIFLRWVSKFVIISRNVKQTLSVLCLQVQGTPWLRLWGCWKSTGSNPNILSYSASSPHLMVSQTAQHKCSRHQLGFVYLPDHTLCPLLLLHSCFCCISVYIKNTVANNNEVLWRCWSCSAVTSKLCNFCTFIVFSTLALARLSWCLMDLFRLNIWNVDILSTCCH